MLSSRASPVKTVNSNTGRSTSAIDLQAANRARQHHHFNTLKYEKHSLIVAGTFNVLL